MEVLSVYMNIKKHLIVKLRLIINLKFYSKILEFFQKSDTAKPDQL